MGSKMSDCMWSQWNHVINGRFGCSITWEGGGATADWRNCLSGVKESETFERKKDAILKVILVQFSWWDLMCGWCDQWNWTAVQLTVQILFLFKPFLLFTIVALISSRRANCISSIDDFICIIQISIATHSPFKCPIALHKAVRTSFDKPLVLGCVVWWLSWPSLPSSLSSSQHETCAKLWSVTVLSSLHCLVWNSTQISWHSPLSLRVEVFHHCPHVFHLLKSWQLHQCTGWTIHQSHD